MMSKSKSKAFTKIAKIILCEMIKLQDDDNSEECIKDLGVNQTFRWEDWLLNHFSVYGTVGLPMKEKFEVARGSRRYELVATRMNAYSNEDGILMPYQVIDITRLK